MSDRIPMRRRARGLAGTRLRPAPETLEGRALMSYGGGLDFTFGSSGATYLTTTTQFLVGAFSPKATATQTNNQLVVVGVGNLVGPGMSVDYTAGFYADRYNPDGTRDSAFNDTALFGTPGLSVSGSAGFDAGTSGYGEATAVAIQADGKIVIAGDVAVVATRTNVVKVVRLDSDGTLDTSFGTGGIVTLGTSGKGDALLDYASSVAILPGGLIAVGGASSPSTTGDTPAVEVLNANGSVDTSYATGGLALAPLPAGAQAYAPIVPVFLSGFEGYTAAGSVGLLAQPGGQVLLVANATLAGGTTADEIVATQFTASGVPDSTYGAAGQAVITPQDEFSTATSVASTAITLQPDGKLIVGGTVTLPSSKTGPSVVRLDADGTIDTTFGIGGVNILGGVIPDGSSPGAIAVQSDGKIVLVDQARADYTRLDANGLPDLGFGTGGTSLYFLYGGGSQQPTLNSGAVGLSIQPDGKILVAGAVGLVRLLGNGATGDYNEDGVSDQAIYLTSSGSFGYVASSGTTPPLEQFGTPGAGNTLPAPGAYDGGGIDELAVYLPQSGAFAIQGYGKYPARTVPFGTPGLGNSLPAPGDYDLSGKTERAVYLPNLGIYAYRPTDGGPDQYIQIGAPGAGRSIPVPADYFGTGQDDIAVYDTASDSFVIQNPSTDQVVAIPFGAPGLPAIPVPGDYDGSGHVELAVYLPTIDALVYRPSGGGPDVVEPFGVPGIGNTLPAPGDYDGSGKTEVAAYLPTLGIFAYRPAAGGPDVYLQVGVPNQTIPFVLASATDTGGSGSLGNGTSLEAGASAEIPLTPDVLEALAGPAAKRKVVLA